MQTQSDNTNADIQTRADWIALANKQKVPIRCILFTASGELCEHNNMVRALNLEAEVSLPTKSSIPERIIPGRYHHMASHGPTFPVGSMLTLIMSGVPRILGENSTETRNSLRQRPSDAIADYF